MVKTQPPCNQSQLVIRASALFFYSGDVLRSQETTKYLFAVQLQFFAVKHVKPSYLPLSELFCCEGYVLLQPLRFKLLGKSGPLIHFWFEKC